MNTVERFFIPKSVDEALALLAEYGDQAAIIAGGSLQALRLPSRVQILIDLLRCGLEGIESKGDVVHIGATTTAATLAATDGLSAIGADALREAGAGVSGQAVRNQVTLAGNLVGTMTWADLSVACLALDARVLISAHGGKKRTLSLTELFDGHPKKVLGRDSIITAVELPRARGVGSAFVKQSRTVADLALVSVAASVRVDKGVLRDVRIALGSVQPRPVRAADAERMLEGVAVEDADFAAAGKAATDGLKITADIRASKEYRREVLAVSVKRALETAVARASGKAKYSPPRRPVPAPWTRAPVGEVGGLLKITVDGVPHRAHIKAGENLLDVLRRLGAVSVKRGCSEGYCGTCAILVEGRLLNACLLLASQVQGCKITTAVGIGTIFDPHPIQTALVEEGAVQCGFCTPGWVVATKSLLDQIPDPTDEEARAAMDGNLCRCTGYVKPLAALQNAAATLRKRS